MDFVKYPNYKPDVMTRRAAMMRSDVSRNLKDGPESLVQQKCKTNLDPL